jgi:protein-S-isoprenylcysteine O-methyltransferase Ste14
MTPIQIVRVRREEKVLAEAFGAEYAAWRAKTWF